LHRIFAFGTLKRGYLLYDVALDGVRRLALVRTDMKSGALATPLHTGCLATYDDCRFVPCDRR
jgi:hypothetical protein